MKKRVNYKVLIASLIIVFLVAFIGSIFTRRGTNTEWYESIKPSITPPNYVFPIVWTILFLLIAISLYLAWTKAKNTTIKVAIIFTINFILNILWSLFYFTMKKPAVAFVDLIFLWFSIIVMIAVTYKVDKRAAWLLVPYLLWVSFAGVLNWLSV